MGRDKDFVVGRLDTQTLKVAGTDITSSILEVAAINGLTASAAELNFNDTAVAGTAVASKTLVLGANKNVDVLAVADLKLGAGAGTSVTATAAEINAICDMSAKIVTVADATNTLALTSATHANKIVKVMDATLAITLPEATGTGDVYTVVQGIAATNSTFVTADTTNCHFHGMIIGTDTDAPGTYTWVAAGAVDTITYDGTAKGGKIYDWVRFTDIATDVWILEGQIKQSGGSEATPLSNA